MLKIVHCADIHAGRPAPRELNEEKSSVRHREIETSLERIVHLCRKEHADLLLVSGDLFEHLHVRPSWAKEASELFKSLQSTKVFVSPGNHDPVVKGSLYKSIQWPDNVTIFDAAELKEVLLPDLHLDVYGFGWTSYLERASVLKGFTAKHPDMVSILLIHGDIVKAPSSGPQGSAQPRSVEHTGLSQYLPIDPVDLGKSQLDYVALGHIHAPSEFKAGKTEVVYPGCPEPLDFGDEGERGVYLVTIDGDGSKKEVKSEFVPLSLRQMRTKVVDVSGLETDERVRNAILDACDASARKRDLWRVTLTGMVDPEIGFDVPSIERDLQREFFFLSVSADYSPAYDLEALGDPRNQSLEARFVRHMQGLRREAEARGDRKAAKLAERALSYGLDALRQGKILLRKEGSN